MRHNATDKACDDFCSKERATIWSTASIIAYRHTIMLTVLSPAKALDFTTPPPPHAPTQPRFLAHTKTLAQAARQYTPADFADLMGISENLATLTAQRFADFKERHTPSQARAALFAFNGDVYKGLDAYHWQEPDIAFAQQHLRILSGLYGVLRPLDLIQAYRLEMGVPFSVGAAQNLYAFWGVQLAQSLEQDLAAHANPVLINLASQEYAQAIDRTALTVPMITPIFKERRNGQLKIISFSAKKARGQMARFVITERIDKPKGLKDFGVDGYRFEPGLSDTQTWIFVRGS